MKFCTVCHEVAQPVKYTPGTFALELLLWIVFFPVGILYSIWRVAKRGLVCPHCKSSAVIPTSSPAAIANRSAASLDKT